MFIPSLDLLYWQPTEDGLFFALKESHIEQPHMKWGRGFRIGFEYTFERDDWSLNLTWTCLPIQHDTEASGHIFPIWSNAPQTSSDFVSHIKAHCRLHLGIVDLELKKPWKLSSFFTLFPRIGVRFASIRQKFYIASSNGSLFPNDTDNFNTKNKYWGIGPEMGLNTTATLGRGFSLISQLTYSLVYGEFYIHESERETKTRALHLNTLETFDQACLLLDLALGLNWRRDPISLHILWEEHLYPGQNQMVLFQPLPYKPMSNQGDLALSGVTLGAVWRF